MGLLSEMDKASGYYSSTPVKTSNATPKKGLLAAMDENTVAPAPSVISTPIVAKKPTAKPLIAAPVASAPLKSTFTPNTITNSLQTKLSSVPQTMAKPVASTNLLPEIQREANGGNVVQPVSTPSTLERVANTSTGSVKNWVGSGLKSVVEMGDNPLNPLMYGIGKYNNLVAPKLMAGTKTLANNLMDSGAQNIAEAKQGASKGGKLAVDLGSGALQLAGDVALGAATGGGTAIPAALRGFGSGIKEAADNGGNRVAQIAYGTLNALTTYLTNEISNAGLFKTAYGKGALDDVFNNAAAKAISKFTSSAAGQEAAKRVASGLYGAAGEGLENVIQDAITPLLQKLTYSKATMGELYSNKQIEGMLYDGLVGAILGGAAGSVKVDTRLSDAVNKANADKVIAQTAVDNVQNATQITPNTLAPNLVKPTQNTPNSTPQSMTLEEYQKQHAIDLMLGLKTEAQIRKDWERNEAYVKENQPITAPLETSTSENASSPKVYTPEELSKIDTSTKEGRLLLGKESDRLNISKQETGTREITRTAANKAWGKVSGLSVGDVLVDLPTALNGDFKSEHNWNVTAVDGDGVQLVNYRTGKAIWIFKDGVKSGDALGFVNDINDNTMLTESEAKSEYDTFVSEQSQDTPQAPTANESTKEVKLPTLSQNTTEAKQSAPEVLSSDSSTGEIVKDGNFVYKNTTRSGWKQNRTTPTPTIEAEVYDALKGNDNVLSGELVDYNGEQKIKTPYVKNIVGVDTTPIKKRQSIGTNIVSPNFDGIVNSIQALSEAGYTYSDPLQFGYQDGKLKLMDFSNASKKDVETATKENYDRLIQFLYDFGLDGYAKTVSEGMRTLSDLQDYSLDEIKSGDMLAEPEQIAVVQEAARTGVKPNNVYFTRNARMVQPKTQIGQTERNANGVIYVFSENPLSASEIGEWELTPIYQQPTAKQSNTIFPENSLGAKIKGNQTTAESSVGAATQGFDKLGAMVDKYGAIPEGENPHSTERITEERIPKQTADDNKVSQTVRTAYEAPVTTNETAEHIEQAVLEHLFSYKKSTDKAALEEADKTIADKGVENALSDWREDIHAGKVTKKLSALGWKLYNEASKAGNGKRAVEILVDISNMTRNGAQATQAASLLKKMSPEYQLYAVQRSVQRMNDQISEVNEKRNNKISGEERRKAKTAAEDMSKAVKEESATAVNDVVSEIAQSAKKQGKKSSISKPESEKTNTEKAAEKLAGKVAATTKPRKAPEINVIDDMVSELFKSAKESPLPEQAALAKRSPIGFLKQAIRNKAEYTDVWNGAKDLLLEKYADNQPALGMLKDYFEKGIVPTYSDATLTSSVKQAIKDLGTKLSDIKELSWADRQKAINAVTNYLVEQTGAVDGDAKALSRNAADKITNLIIDSAPKLTRKQKLEIKQATQDALRKHGVPVESWADETGRLISEGIAKTLEPQAAPKDKAITQIITDDIKKFVGTIPKPIKTVVSRNAIDTYTDFMENRQYYTTAWEKLQTELRTKYAKNPEALKAIDNIINRTADTAATDYYNKKLDGMINKALKSINVKMSELVLKGDASKEATVKAVTDILINESGIDSETAKTVSENIADRFNEMLTARAAKRLSTMFPSKVRDVAEKQSLENKLETLINVGAFDSESFNSIAAERVLGIKDVTINPKLADEFVRAKTEAERAEALDAIYHDVADQVPATFANKFDAWRYTSMLFNPITHIKNILGNYAFLGERSVRNILSASVQTGANSVAHALGGKGFEQTRAIALTKADTALIAAADADYTKFADDIYKVGKFDDVKSKINDYRTIFGRGGKTVVGNAISKTVGVGVEKARTTNSTVLDLEDTWVSRPAYVKALASYLKANKVNFKTADSALLDRARAFAIDEAQKAAYRDHNAFSDWVATAGRGKAKNGVVKGVQTLSEGVLPFRRTLANMFVRAGEYSPLGLAKTLTYDSVRLYNDDITPSEYIDNLSEGLTGTALFALGAFLRAQGIISYGTSGDDKEDKLHETQGKQHFCLNVGGKSYTIDWLAPLVVPIFMGAALYDYKDDVKDGETKLEAVLKLATNITTPMLELSMMSSLNDFIDGFTQAKQQDQNLIYYGIVQGALSYLGQAVPTIGGRIARTIDPTRRTSFTDPTSGVPADLQYFAQTQLGKIPFAASTKQPYVDQWGRTQESDSLVGRLAQNFLSPGYMKDVKVSDMEKEIERLHEDYGKENEVNVLPPVSVKKYFSNNGEDVYMTADEYTQFKKTSGQAAYNGLTKLTSSAEYKAMTDADKAKAVSDVYSQAAEKAKTQVMESRGDMRIPSVDAGKKIQSYVDAGVPEKQAYSLYKSISETGAKANTNAGKYTIVKTIATQGLTPKQQTALVATLYTSHDKETGAVTDESLLPYISNSARLLSLYTQSKGENTAMINMTIPTSFEKYSVTYELTDEEKKLYKDTFTQYFNSNINSLSTEANVEYYSEYAAKLAKSAVVNGRK